MNLRAFAFAALVLGGASLSGGVSAEEALTPLRDFQKKFPDVAAKACPAVVKVTSGPRYGSGVILTPDGLVVTNRRVVTAGNGDEVEIILGDGRTFKAEILETEKTPDPVKQISQDSDIALVKIRKASGLPCMPIRRVDDVMPGDWVAVVGKPFYRGEDANQNEQVLLPADSSDSVSLGMVNGRDRIQDAPGMFYYRGEAILIDTLINPGCEGGAVISGGGELVGIVGQFQTDSRTKDQIDFAVPITVVRDLAAAYKQRLPEALEPPPAPPWREFGRELREAAEKVAPALVRIHVGWDEDPIVPINEGPGPFTGVTVDADGWIATSLSHFGKGNYLKLEVETRDGKRYPAELKGKDLRRDLALLKIDAKGMAVPEFADPANVKIGEVALSVSASFNPVGKPHFSFGIVSGRNREQGSFQTDAMLMFANRGGPLVDARGRVIGMMTQLLPRKTFGDKMAQEHKNGVAFAIPFSMILPTLDRLKQGEELSAPYIGIQSAPPGLNMNGTLVTRVLPKGPAAKAGLQEADLIVELDGRKVLNAFQFGAFLREHLAGDAVRVKVERMEGENTVYKELKVVLANPPKK